MVAEVRQASRAWVDYFIVLIHPRCACSTRRERAARRRGIVNNRVRRLL